MIVILGLSSEADKLRTKSLELTNMSTSRNPDLRLGYAEYVLFPNDGNRHEIIDGDHYMYPAPSTYHQTVSKRLQYFLYSQIELAGLGTVFDAPIDVQLSAYDIVQPDLVVILKNGEAKVTPARIIGAPDVLVEILSPSSIENDSQLKRRLYERVGVQEYWIFDPFENRVTQLTLEDGKYTEQATPQGELRLRALTQVSIPLSQIW